MWRQTLSLALEITAGALCQLFRRNVKSPPESLGYLSSAGPGTRFTICQGLLVAIPPIGPAYTVNLEDEMELVVIKERRLRAALAQLGRKGSG